MTGLFQSDAPMEPTEYEGLGGGLSVREEETALGRELTAADRAAMVIRAPRSGPDAAAAVDPRTGLPADQPNP